MTDFQGSHPVQSEGAPISRPLAVIDIGSTAVRMLVAQLRPGGKQEILESLQQDIRLGDDVFDKGFIERSTIEECVSALRSYKSLLREYHCTHRSQIMAVATSALREAANREMVLDRIYSATGLEVSVIDYAEVNRYVYLSIQSLLKGDSMFAQRDTIVIEVSGGSTDFFVVRRGKLQFSYTYRMGSHRIRELWERRGAMDDHLLKAIESEIKRTIKHIAHFRVARTRPYVLALGGDARFAASHLLPDWDRKKTARLLLSSLENFTARIFQSDIDDNVSRYHLGYSEAATVGPALLTYVMLAKALKLRHIHVSANTMREGVLHSMISPESWAVEFQDQVLNSAMELGRKYEFDKNHAEYVADISIRLFKELQPLHELAPRYGLLLQAAALLHEVGLFISGRSHHKHSMYLILNSGLFGLGGNDLLMTALVARYHRKAIPNSNHAEYMRLNRKDRIAVSKMAALLRVADVFDSSVTQRIRKFTLTVGEQGVTIHIRQLEDITLESLALKANDDLFKKIFGLGITLERT